jgi:hypothetical protein
MNSQDDKGDRYSMILIGVGMIIVLALIEATYRIL